MSTILPIMNSLVSALVDLLFRVGEDLWRRLAPILEEGPSRLLWACGLAFLLVGAILHTVAGFVGWSPSLYRLWLLSVQVFPIPFLGQGVVYLATRRKLADVLMVLVSIAAVVTLVVSFRTQIGIVKGQPGVPQGEIALTGPLRALATWFSLFGITASIGGTLWIIAHFAWSGDDRLRVFVAVLATVGLFILSSSDRSGSVGGFAPIHLVGFVFVLAAIALVSRISSSAPLSPSQLAKRHFRVKATGIGLTAGVILSAVALLPVVPLYMGIANAKFKSVYIQEVPLENNGVYLQTNKGVMQIYSWSIQPDDYPPDTAVLNAADLQTFAIVSKQFDDPPNYRLYNLTSRQIIPWQSFEQKNGELILNAGRLDPGQYELDTPTDNMFGGHTWQFFTLQ